MSMLYNLTYFDEDAKEFFVGHAKDPGVVDERMRELVDEINSIPTLVTMNCCQGGSEPFTPLEVEERGHDGTHCPITYVDFYALHHDYETANLLIAFVVADVMKHAEGGWDRAMGTLSYDADGWVDDDDYFHENGDIELRFRIQGDSPESIPDITAAVRRFKEQARITG